MGVLILLSLIFGSIFLWWGRFTLRTKCLPSGRTPYSMLLNPPAASIMGWAQITGSSIILLSILVALTTKDEELTIGIIYMGGAIAALGMTGGLAVHYLHELRIGLTMLIDDNNSKPRKSKRKNSDRLVNIERWDDDDTVPDSDEPQHINKLIWRE